jgi:hypothetical protein
LRKERKREDGSVCPVRRVSGLWEELHMPEHLPWGMRDEFAMM